MPEKAHIWQTAAALLSGFAVGYLARRQFQRRQISSADAELAENTRRKARQLRTELERRGGYRGS